MNKNGEKIRLVVDVEQSVDGSYWCNARNLVCDCLLVGCGGTVEEAMADMKVAYEEIKEMKAEEGVAVPALEYDFVLAPPLRKVTVQVIRGKNNGSYDINLADDNLDYSIFATGKNLDVAKDNFFELYDEMRKTYEAQDMPFEEIVAVFGEVEEE